MKNLISITGLVLALSMGSSAWAGGIQIDPTGTGSISGSKFIVDPGSSIGDALFQGVAAPGNAGIMWGHNRISLATAGLPGELTFVFGRLVTSVAGFGTNTDYLNFGAAHSGGTSFFSLYWEPTSANINSTTGVGYAGEGVGSIFLAAGTLSINAVQGASLGQLSADPAPGACAGGTTAACLAAGHANATSMADTARLNGSATLDIEFTTQNPLYVVNTLSTATIDMFLSASLAAPYQFGRPASDTVGTGGSLLAGSGLGADGVNNLSCGGIGGAGSCNVQVQMNSTLQFAAGRVPEPGTLALAGMALGLLGWRARRS